MKKILILIALALTLTSCGGTYELTIEIEKCSWEKEIVVVDVKDRSRYNWYGVYIANKYRAVPALSIYWNEEIINVCAFKIIKKARVFTTTEQVEVRVNNF